MTKTLFERHRQNPRTKSCIFTTLLEIVWEMFIRLETYIASSVSPHNYVDGSNQCKQGATRLPLNHAPHLKRNASWWRHQMETFSVLLDICVGNSPVPGEFPAQRPVTQSFDVFFDLRLNKRLSKQWCGWWFETPSSTLWRHCHGIVVQEWLVVRVNQH